MGMFLFLSVLALLVLLVVRTYNRLVVSRNGFKNAFSQIEVQMQRRYDLIPSLVATAKGALAHEQNTLTAVINARNTASAALGAVQHNPADGEAINRLSIAENSLAHALRGLQVTIEAYPELKANQNMLQLSEELASTENRLGFARQAYNDSVTGYNDLMQVFPNNLVAGSFGFRSGALLEVDQPEARRPPAIQF